MDMELYRETKPLQSLNQLTNAADANGTGIDCIGAEEAVLSLVVGGFGGTVPTLDVHWEESADNVTFVDIPLAAHSQIIVDPVRIVAAHDIQDSAYTIAAQPANPSRLVTLVVDANDSTTEHKVAIVGTGWNSVSSYLSGAAAVPLSYTFVLSTMLKASRIIPGYIWKTVTSPTGSASASNAPGDTFQLGVNNADLITHEGYLDLRPRKRYIRAVSVKGGAGQLGAFVAQARLGRFRTVPVVPAIPLEFAVVS